MEVRYMLMVNATLAGSSGLYDRGTGRFHSRPNYSVGELETVRQWLNERDKCYPVMVLESPAPLLVASRLRDDQ